MSKKVKEVKEPEVKTHLAPEQYWQWKSCIFAMWLAEQKLKNAELEAKVLSRDAELASARMQLFVAKVVESKKTSLESAKQEYDILKRELENDIGQSLNGKAIDDITFEVKTLEE